jgi:hypothetical protein
MKRTPLKRSRRPALDSPLRSAQFEEGLHARPLHCPRCGQVLQQEPSSVYCRWGCTRRFVLAGARISDQFEWERSSGLLSHSEA